MVVIFYTLHQEMTQPFSTVNSSEITQELIAIANKALEEPHLVGKSFGIEAAPAKHLRLLLQAARERIQYRIYSYLRCINLMCMFLQ